MAVDQTKVNNLKNSIEAKLLKMAYSYATRMNNAIKTPKVDRDIIRLWTLLKNLERYDVTESYFDDQYILNISDEWKRYCGFKEGMIVEEQPTATPLDEQSSSLRKFRVYRHNTSGTITGDETDSGFILTETPLLYVSVRLNGFQLDIGDSTKSRECYFSDDNGATAKALASIDNADKLFVNIDRMNLVNIVSSDQFLIEII